MKKETIEIFDEEEVDSFISDGGDNGGGDDDDGGGGGDDPDLPSSSCSGIKHFTNEGIVIVEHTCDSIYLDIEVYNSTTGKEVGAVKTIISNNEFHVTMTPSIDGYVIWEKIR